MKVISLLIFLTLALDNCNNKRSFDRESELNIFLQKNHVDTTNKEDKYVLIFQNYSCNSCFRDLFDKLSQTINKTPIKKHIVLSKYEASFYNQVKTINNSNILIDSLKKLPELGLSFGADLFIKYENGRVVNWAEISNDNLKKIKNMVN